MTGKSTLNLLLTYVPLAVVLLLVSGCAQLGIYRLEIQAVPQEGPAPLTVSFTAEIRGGLDTSPELYCQKQTWDFGDGRLVSVMPMCRVWRPGVKIDRLFQHRYTYEKPGVYQASVSYGPLESEPILVKVLE